MNLSWTMQVAVISTMHHPQGWKPNSLASICFKTDDPMDGVILHLENQDHDAPSWLKTLAEALVAEGYEWVRFDQCGEVVHDLPTFKWD